MDTEAGQPQKLMTVAEVAPVLRVSRETTYRLVHSGELPAIRVGGQLRIDRDVLAEYLSTPEHPRPAA